MAVPKRKLSNARQNKRRSNARKLNAPALARCPKYDEYKLTHRVCGSYGCYNDRDVLKKEA